MKKTVAEKLAERFGGKPSEYEYRTGRDELGRPVRGWFQYQKEGNRYLGPSLYEIQCSPQWPVLNLSLAPVRKEKK